MSKREERNAKGKGYDMGFAPESSTPIHPTGTVHVFHDKMKAGFGFRDELLAKLNARAVRALTTPPKKRSLT